MKKSTLLLLLIGMLTILSSCKERRNHQTAPKVNDTLHITDTTKKRETADTDTIPYVQHKKTSDRGFVWFLLEKNGLMGANDKDGYSIIPIIYDKIRYVENDDGHQYFIVYKNNHCGIYSQEGTLILPIDRHYEYAELNIAYSDVKAEYFYWICKDANSEYKELTDATGNIVIPLDKKYKDFNIVVNKNNGPDYIMACVLDHKNDTYMNGADNNHLFDLDGNLIYSVMYPDWEYVGYEEASVIDKHDQSFVIHYPKMKETTKFDYHDFDHLYAEEFDHFFK